MMFSIVAPLIKYPKKTCSLFREAMGISQYNIAAATEQTILSCDFKNKASNVNQRLRHEINHLQRLNSGSFFIHQTNGEVNRPPSVFPLHFELE